MVGGGARGEHVFDVAFVEPFFFLLVEGLLGRGEFLWVFFLLHLGWEGMGGRGAYGIWGGHFAGYALVR